MFRIIQRIHERPIAQRRRITFFTALFLTALVALFWLVTKMATDTPKEAITKAPGPMEALFEGIGESIEVIQNSFSM